MLDPMQSESVQRGDDPAESPSSGERGFSLMELVVVMAVGIMMAAVAIPNLMRSKVRAEMLSQSKMVYQAMGVARINAIQRGVPVGVSLESVGSSGGGVIFAWQDENANEQEDGGEPRIGEWRVQPKIRLTQETANPLYRLGGSAARRGVLFLPTGAGIVSEAGTPGIGQGGIVITDIKGNQLLLLVHAGAGTVQQAMWDPTAGSWDFKSTRHWRY